MAQSIPTREQETQAIHKKYDYLYRYLRGFILVVFGIWLGSMFFSDTEGYATNVFTELIGIIATYLIFDEITKRANKRELREQLLADLKSTSVSPAVNALDRLRREGWLSDDYFIGKDLSRANWEGAYIGGLNFEGAKLIRATFNNVTTYNGQETRLVKFKTSNLSQAHLVGANLVEARLEEANLRWAHLEGADLRWAHLKGANLSQAHLVGANLVEAHLEGANLASARLEGADLYRAYLESADLYGAHLEGTDLVEAHLEGANLTFANLEGADLYGAHLTEVFWATPKGEIPATLPDGTVWTPEADMKRFTDENHPEFEETLAKINEIRVELGYEPIKLD